MAGTVVEEKQWPGGKRFQVVIGDLLAESTDAIVNAANGHLAHGGGVAAAIADAAGRELERDGDRLVRERGGPVPTGEAVVTVAGNLPHKGVIHAVGPRLGQGQEEQKLTSALKAAFLRAHERGWASVSFPAVSAGIFAVPLAVCARAYVRAVGEFWAEHPETTVRLLRLVVFKGPIVEEVRAALG